MFENNHIFTDLQKAVKRKKVTGIMAYGLLLKHLKSSTANYSEVAKELQYKFLVFLELCHDISPHEVGTD